MIYAENIFICIAVPLALSLLFIRDGARRFVLAFLTGMLVCLIAAYISGFLCYAAGMEENDAAVFLSPMVEELMKFLPLLAALFLLGPEDDHLTLIGVGIGAGFATFENCCYILSSGGGSRLAFILVRGLAVGVMHIVSVLAVTMGLLMARRFRAVSLPGIIGALSLSMIFHGLYNLLVSGSAVFCWVGYSLPILTAIIIFLLYSGRIAEKTNR